MKKIFIIFCTSIFIAGCQSQLSNEQELQIDQSSQTQTGDVEKSNDQDQEDIIENEGDINMKQLSITIDSQEFSITLEENETVEALIKQLPMTITMNELHGNEKYYYLDQKLPSQPQNINRIEAGDFMLFGSDCIVLFYESFTTSYSYTRLGRIDNVEAFIDELGSGSVEITLHQ